MPAAPSSPRRAGVSEPTVTRFSRAVGCKGLRELKVRLAQSMVVGRIYIEPPPLVGTDLARPAMWRSVFAEIRKAITAVEEQLRREDVDRAAEAIAACTQLVAFGVGGGSTVVVAEVENRFFRLGVAVSHTSDPHLMRMMAATLGSTDVVIAVSTTGKAADVIEATTIAKRYGALAIAVTKPKSRACRPRRHRALRACSRSRRCAEAHRLALCASGRDRSSGRRHRLLPPARGAGADAAHQDGAGPQRPAARPTNPWAIEAHSE